MVIRRLLYVPVDKGIIRFQFLDCVTAKVEISYVKSVPSDRKAPCSREQRVAFEHQNQATFSAESALASILGGVRKTLCTPSGVYKGYAYN